MMRLAAIGRSVAVWVVALGASAGVLSAQQGKTFQFEVAAIKPGDPKLPGSGTSTRGDRFEMTNAPLKQWVEMGLSVSDYALKAPAWLDTARFDLNAKVPADAAAATHDPRPEMLRALLVERFGLKWHEETGTVSGFELVQDKKVLVQPATLLERLRGRGSGSGPTTVNGTNMTMAVFAETLGKVLGRPVVDATHLDGGYDIQLRWRPDNEAGLAEQRQYGKQYGYDVDALPDSVFTAIREQLGLRLQAAKVPSRVIVVDSINREPTAN